MHERTTDAAATAVALPERQGRSYTPGASEQDRAMTGTEAGRLAGRPAASREPLTRSERLLVTVFVTMFGTMLAAGALGFTTLSGQLLDMQREIGKLSERMARVETLIETHLVPASNLRDPAGP